MRNLLKAVDPGDLIQLLERAHREAGASSSSVDFENRGVCTIVIIMVIYAEGCHYWQGIYIHPVSHDTHHL